MMTFLLVSNYQDVNLLLYICILTLWYSLLKIMICTSMWNRKTILFCKLLFSRMEIYFCQLYSKSSHLVHKILELCRSEDPKCLALVLLPLLEQALQYLQLYGFIYLASKRIDKKVMMVLWYSIVEVQQTTINQFQHHVSFCHIWEIYKWFHLQMWYPQNQI